MPFILRYYHSLPHLSHKVSGFLYSKAVFATAFRADVIFDSTVIIFCKYNSSFICCTEAYKKRFISTMKTMLKDRHDMHEDRHLSSSSSGIEHSESDSKNSKNENFLHISPSGDFWFGTTIFAAVSEDDRKMLHSFCSFMMLS
jgi:hypothetical protein